MYQSASVIVLYKRHVLYTDDNLLVSEAYGSCGPNDHQGSFTGETKETKEDICADDKQEIEEGKPELMKTENDAISNQKTAVKSYYQGSMLDLKNGTNERRCAGAKTWSLTDDTIVTKTKQKKGIIYQARAKVIIYHAQYFNVLIMKLMQKRAKVLQALGCIAYDLADSKFEYR